MKNYYPIVENSIYIYKDVTNSKTRKYVVKYDESDKRPLEIFSDFLNPERSNF